MVGMNCKTDVSLFVKLVERKQNIENAFTVRQLSCDFQTYVWMEIVNVSSTLDQVSTDISLLLYNYKGKRRRAHADFPGADVILKQIAEKPSRKRVGIVSSGPPARGMLLYSNHSYKFEHF